MIDKIDKKVNTDSQCDEFAKKVTTALVRHEKWLSNYGWAGYDPYDVKGQDWFIELFGKQNWFFSKIRGLLAIMEEHLPPVTLRKVLRIEKLINAKGMGLLASAYLSLYRAKNQKMYLEKAEDILTWLSANYNKKYPGFSWGYPFHWQSRIFLPCGTPSSVVTATVGDAWIDHYLLTGSKESLNICYGIADFFLKSLNRYEKSLHEICFSYTPLDDFKVHNANLFVAAFLSRFGVIEKKSEMIELALKAMQYTLSEQNLDGSFFYWGSELPTIIDHYHTGFVIRHLDTIRKSMDADFIAPAIEKGYSFYLNNLFTPNGLPKLTPDRLYPIDVHSCSEAILTLTQMESVLASNALLNKVFDFIESSMLSEQLYYIAKIQKGLLGERKIDIPYLRWGQAWMFLALAKLNEKLQER